MNTNSYQGRVLNLESATETENDGGDTISFEGDSKDGITRLYVGDTDWIKGDVHRRDLDAALEEADDNWNLYEQAREIAEQAIELCHQQLVYIKGLTQYVDEDYLPKVSDHDATICGDGHCVCEPEAVELVVHLNQDKIAPIIEAMRQLAVGVVGAVQVGSDGVEGRLMDLKMSAVVAVDHHYSNFPSLGRLRSALTKLAKRAPTHSAIVVGEVEGASWERHTNVAATWTERV